MISRTALRKSEGFLNLIVYWCLKTFIIMAKFDLKFFDCTEDGSTIKVNVNDSLESLCIEVYCSASMQEDYPEINEEIRTTSLIYLDKSTSIKFAKTLRTEINKIKDEDNG